VPAIECHGKEDAMDKETQERIAVFRFGLISSLVSHKGLIEPRIK
jgi:hypothetical protein